ncbi:MAG: hypothetical protein ABSB53_07825 [Nitrososphaerales archaeon]
MSRTERSGQANTAPKSERTLTDEAGDLPRQLPGKKENHGEAEDARAGALPSAPD